MQDIFQILTDITVDGRKAKLSTVDLSLPDFGIVDKGFETAVILEPDSPRESIEVIAWYRSYSDALRGHADLVENPDRILAMIDEGF